MKSIRISHENVGKYIISFMDSSSAYHFQALRKNTSKKNEHDKPRISNAKKRKTLVIGKATSISVKCGDPYHLSSCSPTKIPPCSPFYQEKTKNTTWLDLGKCRGPGNSAGDLSGMVKVTRNQWLFVTSRGMKSGHGGWITWSLWFFPQKFTITLPKTNIFAPEKWLVGKRSGFLLGVSAYFQGTNMLVLGSRNLSSDVSFEVDHILGACLFLAC